jgi:UPF0716 protein FxsA
MARSHKRGAKMPLLFFLFPLAEIAVFILIGNAIGILATLALVVASSVIGATMLRDAGLLTLFRLEERRGDPATILAEGGTRILAGILLLIPGFLSDLAAIALLTPIFRKPLMSGAVNLAGRRRPGRSRAPTIVDGEFTRLDRDP